MVQVFIKKTTYYSNRRWCYHYVMEVLEKFRGHRTMDRKRMMEVTGESYQILKFNLQKVVNNFLPF